MSNTYSSRKALKLATALYMVTDIMSEKEPLKWHLRDCAVALLEQDAAGILRGIEQTLNILSIARIARAVSPMNSDVLEEELRALAILLSARGSAEPSPAPLFGPDFFLVLDGLNSGLTSGAEQTQETFAAELEKEVFQSMPTPPVASEDEDAVYTTPVERRAPMLAQYELVKQAALADVRAAEEREAKKEAVREEPKAKPVAPPSAAPIRSIYVPKVTLSDVEAHDRGARSEETKNTRRDIILHTIAEKKSCSIKDISAKLQSVSEKTIQRELSSMVEEGILFKEGDRRWSTYRIARLS